MACSKDQLLTNQLDLEEELSCTICLELYDDPVSLPCQHNFCRKCIREHLQRKSDVSIYVIGSPTRFQCPNCRESTELNDADIKTLPRNFALQNIITKMQSVKLENDEEDVRKICCCHHNKPLILYCNTCDEAMCIECIPTRSHENHTIVHFKDKLKIYQEEVEQSVLPHLVMSKESAMVMKEELNRSYEEIKELIQINWKGVADSFQELRSAVNQKESELIFLFESKKNEMESHYKSQTDRMDVQLGTLENLITKFSTMNFNDYAKITKEMKLDKESCEEASREESVMKEKMEQFRIDGLRVSKQMSEMTDKLNKIKSQIDSMEIVSESTPDVELQSGGKQSPYRQMAARYYVSAGNTADAWPSPALQNSGRVRQKVKIVNPNTGKDISNEIYSVRRTGRSSSVDKLSRSQGHCFDETSNVEINESFNQKKQQPEGTRKHKKKKECSGWFTDGD